MPRLRTLLELHNYNYWARDRQLEACAKLSDEQLLRPVGNSFSSLRDTLAHMVGAEWIWLERWRWNSPQSMPGVPEGLPFAETLRGWHDQLSTLRPLQERWREVERGVREYIAGLDEAALERQLVYSNIQAQKWSYPLWQTHLHVVNHQTYHRGQVTTLLRQLGPEPAAIDFLVYYDKVGGAGYRD